ncbi:MAG: hypothetical protein AB9M53_03860 [Leptothrix sp. (in: b-proteobacteria)]
MNHAPEPTSPPGIHTATERRSSAPDRQVLRLYRAAQQPVRAAMLGVLLRPLGLLSLAGVAAGAFSRYLHHHGSDLASQALDDVTRISNEQIAELLRFVAQVNPEALHEAARTASSSPLGLAALGASVAVLVLRHPAATPGADADRRALSTTQLPR